MKVIYYEKMQHADLHGFLMSIRVCAEVFPSTSGLA